VSVVILLADGARPDTLDAALANGTLPNLARMRDEGGGALHTITSCFPSVTGPAYAPFLMGRFPGPIGLPGLRWFDRAREVCTFPDYTRSYVGYQLGFVDRDIDAHAPTIFELCESSLGALNVIGRGLPKRNRIGRLTAKARFAPRERISPGTSRAGSTSIATSRTRWSIASIATGRTSYSPRSPASTRSPMRAASHTQ